jgi:hypothetical protein
MQVTVLCLELFHLKDEDVNQFAVLTLKGKSKGGAKYEMVKRKEASHEGKGKKR